MKTITPNSFQKIFVILCLFFLVITYGQGTKSTTKTVFGKTVKAGTINPNNGIVRCATVEYEQYLQAKNPKRMTNAQFESWLAPLVKKQKAMRTSSQSGGIITIPIVVHVIHSGQDYGVAPNILDAQVQSQITVLNQDYRKMVGTPGNNINPVGADTQIQFELAKQDPTGNPTNGIDRVAFTQESWSGYSTDIDLIVKPATIWDPTQYLNMWTVNMNDDVLGYAQFPDGSGLSGLDVSGGDANSDGVVAAYNTFGSIDYGASFLLNAPYNKGRTMSHEVGHWLGLIHIWGDTACGDDFCADTPVHHDKNFSCPTVVDCDANGNEMVENYMDYTNDACMNIFTLDQKARMTTIINNAARRSTLKTSTKNSAIALFSNDAEVKLETSIPTPICGVANQVIKKITIYNRGTSALTAATLNYNINSGSNTVYNWTGSLATNQFATFSITINSASNGTINAAIVNANGVTDQRASNNTASGNFTIPTAPSNFTFTNYVFRLQQDLFGSETTWELKNGVGTILHIGGPYLDSATLPAILTENWTLANNQCYTFTINDAASDGICCGATGDGFYDIKSTDGLTVVDSGSNFGQTIINPFTTNILGTNDFESSNDIYLYPNPTKGTINIHLPNDFGLPNSFTISNSLGQKISKKEVSKENDLTINASGLSNGIYFITVVKEDQKKTLQFIKE
jgi:hypothetical protein